MIYIIDKGVCIINNIDVIRTLRWANASEGHESCSAGWMPERSAFGSTALLCKKSLFCIKHFIKPSNFLIQSSLSRLKVFPGKGEIHKYFPVRFFSNLFKSQNLILFRKSTHEFFYMSFYNQKFTQHGMPKSWVQPPLFFSQDFSKK